MEIRIEYSKDALWGGVDPESLGYNEALSEKRFERLLIDACHRAYPGCQVEVVQCGSDRMTSTFRENGHEVIRFDDDWVAVIVDHVWTGDWQVCCDECEACPDPCPAESRP